MPNRRHYDVKRPLPERKVNQPNEQTHDITNLASYPVCVGAFGTCSPILNGTPGAITYITWNPVSPPTQDISNFIGSTPTQNVRIPVDGFYDFWYMVVLPGSTTGNFAIRSGMELAITSDTGFLAPVFTSVILGPATNFTSGTAFVGGKLRWEVSYKGSEFHANDLVRFGLNMYNDAGVSPGADITGTVIPYSEFKFSYAIPNEAVQGTSW